jgi:CheY-like chemotaxis protein
VRLPLAKQLPADFEVPVALSAAVCARLHILLVEDNPANRKLARYILEDRGHIVEIAGDGQEAIRLAERNRYDVILMDVQMPGMDGLEATAAIRKREAGGRRVPILAMTAHAMRGDRERCLAAGMDGYLSKPIHAQEMIGLVESLARGAAPAEAAATAAPAEKLPEVTAVVFDPEEAVKRCYNNQEILRQMASFFLDEVENVFPQMRAALERGDLVQVGRLGHRIKGTIVYLGAERARQAALRVERFCKSSGAIESEARDAVGALEQECETLRTALAEHSLATKRPHDA